MEDSVRAMLDRLEKELFDKIRKLREELSPLERELIDVRRAKAAIQGDESEKAKVNKAYVIPSQAPKPTQSPYRGLTMKQLTVKALTEHFQNGATASELIEFFSKEWGRGDIMRESFSPQLSRLKGDGVVTLEGKVWKLVSDEETPPKDQSGGAPKITGGGGTPPNESQEVKDIFG